MKPRTLLLGCAPLVAAGILIFYAPSNKPLKAQQFQAAQCWFDIPSAMDVTCGTVNVPEDRSKPLTENNAVQIAIAVFHATMPLPDPVFLLAGGPGQGAIDSVVINPDMLSFVMENRDLVAIDQRGTGYTVPSLDCPEYDAQECRQRLVGQGIDLNAYNSANNAADIEDVRAALGYNPINLLGGSYGTRLGLTVLRDHPQAIRSAVLDSVVPPQVHVDAALDSLPRALAVLYADCAANPACHEAYPDLENTLYALVEQLDSMPVSIQVDEESVSLDGQRFISLVGQALYYVEAFPALPKLIYDTYNGETETLETYVRGLWGAADTINEGMMWSVHCSEEVEHETEQEFREAALKVPAAIRDQVVEDRLLSMVQICQEWNVSPASDLEEQPVSSDVPTLLLAGSYDPVAPPEWAALAGKTLSHHYLYVFPGTGHIAFRTSPCAQSIILQFLDSPAADQTRRVWKQWGRLFFR